MKKLLYYKHWHLFLLIFICAAWTSPSPLKEIVNSIAVVTFTLWIYTIGLYGQKRVAELGLKTMNLKLFKANVYIVGAFFVIGLVLSAIQGNVIQTSDPFHLQNIIYTVGLYYIVFAMAQTLLFACKTIAQVEYRREVSFADYFDFLLLMVLFMIGIWFLQPKVNRLIASEVVVEP